MSDEGNTSEGQSPSELREAYDGLKEQFASLQGEYRNLLATTTFKEAGLNPKHSELFLKVNGDAEITAEAAKKFAAEYNLQVPESGKQSEETPPATPESGSQPSAEEAALGGMEGAGSRPATGGGAPEAEKMTVAEFEALMAKDPATAVQKYADGLVQHADGNMAAEDAQRRGLIKG